MRLSGARGAVTLPASDAASHTIGWCARRVVGPTSGCASTRTLRSMAEVDEVGESVLAALRGKPPRVPWLGGRHVPGQINASEVARARSRALSRLGKAHRAEFERYWVEEQWKIVDGVES